MRSQLGGSPLLRHFFSQFGGDVPDKTEDDPAAHGAQGGEQQAKNLDTQNGTGGLNGSGSVITDEAQHGHTEGGAQALSQTAQHVEGAVDGAFGPFAGEILIVFNGFGQHTPLHHIA